MVKYLEKRNDLWSIYKGDHRIFMAIKLYIKFVEGCSWYWFS